MTELPQFTVPSLSPEEGGKVAEILQGRPEADVATVLSRLRMVRRAGVAVNLERAEEGVVAVGRAVALAGEPVAAICLAIPSSRYRAQRLLEYDAWLRAAAEAMEAALETDG